MITRVLSKHIIEHSPLFIHLLRKYFQSVGCLYDEQSANKYRLMINVQLHKLKSNLEIILELGAADHPLLPWILISGGIFAQQPERNWFIGQLLSVTSYIGIYSWAEMIHYLESVIYIEYFCEIPFKQLWGEVVTKRSELDLVDLDVW